MEEELKPNRRVDAGNARATLSAKLTQSGIASLLWASLIAFTSSFVIFTPEFFQITAHVIPGSAERSEFAQFWAIGGVFFIKGWHATEYAILDGLLFRWLRIRLIPTRALAAALLFCVLFAASDEWHQTFIPGRDGNLRDVLIDSAGACIATVIQFTKYRRTAS